MDGKELWLTGRRLVPFRRFVVHDRARLLAHVETQRSYDACGVDIPNFRSKCSRLMKPNTRKVLGDPLLPMPDEPALAHDQSFSIKIRSIMKKKRDHVRNDNIQYSVMGRPPPAPLLELQRDDLCSALSHKCSRVFAVRITAPGLFRGMRRNKEQGLRLRSFGLTPLVSLH